MYIFIPTKHLATSRRIFVLLSSFTDTMVIVESRYGANEILKFVSYNVHDRKIKLDNRKLEKKLKKVEKYYNDIHRANNRRKANQEISSGLLTRNKQPPTLFEP